MKNKRISNNERGITLVALVVTIIVLLILAGISIGLVLGNNGVINKATEARNTSIKSQIIESIKTDLLDEIAKNKGETLTEEQVKNVLNKYCDDVPENLSDLTQSVISKTGSDTIVLSEILSDINIKTIPKELIPIPSSLYGKKVTNYRDGEDWLLLYQGAVETGGESRIYLIKSGSSVPRTEIFNGMFSIPEKYNGTDDFLDETAIEDYPAIKQGLLYKTYKTQGENAGVIYDAKKDNGTTYTNMRCTEYLLDSTLQKWKDYEDSHTEKYADYVIGGPTLELIVAAWNKVNPDRAQTIPNPSGMGYTYDDFFYNDEPLKNQENDLWGTGGYYWLACPSSGEGNVDYGYSRVDRGRK